MSDYRIKYLKLMETRPLLISVVATIILCAMSIFGLLWESDKECQPDLQLWLIVVVIRSALRLTCRLYVGRMMGTDENIIQQINTGSKCVDILDVFGIVWLAVGNLLVFNNFGCVYVSPIVFFSGLFYVCFSYLNFMLPPILRCSLSLVRPTHPDDLAYLRRTADADREGGLGNIRSVGVGGAANLSAAYSPDLTPERVQHWSTWLETYGCFAVSYHPSMNLLAKSGGVAVPGDLPSSLKTIGGGASGGTGKRKGKGSGSGVTSDGTRYTALDQVGDEDDENEDIEGEGGGDIEMGTVHNDANHSIDNNNTINSSVDNSTNIDDTDAVTAANTAANTALNNNLTVTSTANNTNNTTITINTSTHGYSSVNNVESDFCSICLTPFETVAETQRNISNTVGSGSGASGVHSNISMIGIPSTSANNDGVVGTDATSVNRVVENNNIIVRYPCQGHHYFHAHCLHSWLQVSSARYLNMVRRPGVTLATLDPETAARQVTCPCCRENPHSLLATPVGSGHHGSGRGSGNSGGERNSRHSSNNNNIFVGIQAMV